MSKDTTSKGNVQGEGDYDASRRYRENVTNFVNKTDVDKLSQNTAPLSAREARDYAMAEERARARSKGDDPADVGIMYTKQSGGMSQYGVVTAEKAYQLWEARGRPHGSADADWYEAERLLADEVESPLDALVEESGIESFPASDAPSTRSPDRVPSNAGDKWRVASESKNNSK